MRSIARGLKHDELVVGEVEYVARHVAIARRGIEVEVIVNRRRAFVAARFEFASAAQVDRRVQRAGRARWPFPFEVREAAALPRQIVVAVDDACVQLFDGLTYCLGRRDVERKRAEVFDDDEVGVGKRGAQRANVDRVLGSDRQSREHDIVGTARVFDLARDSTRRKSKLAERGFPLARLDGDTVVAAKPERNCRYVARHSAATLTEGDVGEPTVRGVEHRTGDRVGLLLRTHDRRSCNQLLGGRNDEDHRHDRDVVRADTHDLGVVDIDAFGCGLELAERVDSRGCNEAMARRRGDRPFREPDRFFFVTGERDPHERAQTVRLGRDRDDRRTRIRREVLVELIPAELHDADDAAIEVEAERRERDRLDVAHDLLRVFAGVRNDVHFRNATVGFGDQARD